MHPNFVYFDRQMSKQQTRNNSNPSGSTQNNQDTNDDRLLMLLQALNENLARQNECQAQFLGVMQRVTQPAPPLQVVIAPPVPDTNLLFQTFRKLGAVPFVGDVDPLDADEWLVQTEKILEMFECTGRQKVSLATFMFRGVAEMWWRIVKEPYQTIDDAIAWATFKRQFTDMFVPKHFIDQMQIEFEQLQQGSMTVAEYNQKFLRLSRFAEKLIDTEVMKVERFIGGLSPTIQKDVTIVIAPQTLEDAIKRAYWSEDANKKIVQEEESRRNVWPPTPDDDIPTFQEYSQQFERATADMEYQGIPKCDHCGKNHETSACRHTNEACFACGGLDHKVQDCPSKRSKVQGSSSRKQLGVCFLCGEVGHKVQNCSWKRKRVGGSQPQVP